MDTASLIIGIISAIIGFIPCVNMLVIIPAIVGLILGIISYRSKKAEGQPTGIALAGIILNALPLVIMVGFFGLAMINGDTGSISDMTIK